MTDQNFQKFIEELKSRNEIVEVVSAYCQLERKGGSYWARCPLPGHMEKTPSFCVNQAGQFFKCFGCQRGGDVIKFIMEVESLGYMEAVKFLANRANMEMPNSSFQEDAKLEENAKNRAVRLAILKDTARFYVDNLQKKEAEPYLDYIYKRGFNQTTIRAFGLGCSLDYNSLPQFLKQKGYKYEDMVAAGVVAYNKDTEEYTDFEAKRLIVPIIDSFSNVLAFGGRVLEAKPDFAKYKNTRETSVFIKNRTIFNANNIKKLKREVGTLPYLILVEGYMDVIALHASGIKNAIASMGTSLTVEQARLIQRYSETVIVSYDGDAAGQKATFRGMQILKDAGLNVKVVSIPDKMDPDEYVKKRGVDAYKDLLLSAQPLIDYKLTYLSKTFNLNDAVERRKFLDKSLQVISESDKEFEREELLRKLSEVSNITYESLKRDLDGINKKSAYKPDIAVKDVQSEVYQEEDSALLKAERFILSAIIFKKSYAKVSDLDDLEFTSQLRSEIAALILQLNDTDASCDSVSLARTLGDDYLSELSYIFDAVDGVYCPNGYEKYYNDCLKCVKRHGLEVDLSYLENFCKNETDVTKQMKIIQKIQEKNKLLFQLKTEDKI